jgi:hypothetical protein
MLTKIAILIVGNENSGAQAKIRGFSEGSFVGWAESSRPTANEIDSNG